MKKYLIQFMCVDMPSIEDDGVCSGANFGIHKQAFNSREDAEKYLEEVMIPEDKANLEECYGLNDKDFDPPVELRVESYLQGSKEIIVYDKYDGNEINTTMYEISEVEVEND